MSHAVPLSENTDTGCDHGRWMVVIFDDDVTVFDDVVFTVMRATGCGIEEAYIEVWEAQIYGKASVHFAQRPECETVAEAIRRIGVKTEVVEEWPE